MVAPGVDHDILLMDETQAQHLAADIFGDQFTQCLDVTFKEHDEHFKTYSDLTFAQGQICVRPGTRKNIKAFVQWTRTELRLGRDPAASPFPIDLVSNLICRYKTHEKFLIPGRVGIPLKYICSEIDEADGVTEHEDFSMTMLLLHLWKAIRLQSTQYR